MFGLSESAPVYVHREAVDFRCGVNGLVAVIEQGMKLDAFAAACFVFSNRPRNRVRVVTWERNGFWVCSKRLERERFIWPRSADTVVELTLLQLQWLLSGVDVASLRGHQRLAYRRAS